jgi:hypothetical protein
MKHLNFITSCAYTISKTALYSVVIVICFILPNQLDAQIIYATLYSTNGQQRFIYKINLSTCDFCAVTPASPNLSVGDMVVLPGGDILNIFGIFFNGLKRTQPPPSTQIVWQSNDPQLYYTGQLAPNGLVYLAGDLGLGTFDPATNTVAYLGNWPSTISFVDEIYYINGVLYGTASDAVFNPLLVEINISDPSMSIILGPLFPTAGAEGGTWNGNTGIFYSLAVSDASDIFFYNAQTQSSELICDLPNDLYIVGLSFPPAGVPEFGCVCNTNAGVLTGAPLNICPNNNADFSGSTGVFLESDDILRYILFSNPSDTAGSIIATSNTPSFSFAPPMQTGVTYYIAAMAGNNLNGNVDLTDPCLDFSNALQVIWRPLPAVTFSAANPNVCAGACTTVTAAFTGTAPFTLTYTSPTSGTVTQTFPGNTGTFQVCTLPGSPPGSLVVPATALTDAFCTCN